MKHSSLFAEILCDKLIEPDHSTISCSSNDESIGSKCEVVCDEGYYLNGASLLTCGWFIVVSN